MALLSVDRLRTYFHTRNGVVRAVDGISFDIEKGETIGLVGESGSGKSVTGYSLLGLIPSPPGRIESGSAGFSGIDLLHSPISELRKIRGKRIAMIFQDPMTCLNPYLKVGEQIMEPLLIHENVSREEAKKRSVIALQEVGILDAARRMDQYPHQFSGGMRQRVMIAMALITSPELLIADEPTTALDVTVQAQILELIRRRQAERGTAIIFITHDLGIVAGLTNRIFVMYAGKIVEKGLTREIFYRPKHPYTRALLDSIPSRHVKGEDLYTIPGLPPDLSKPIRGCSFALRCRDVKGDCHTRTPDLFSVSFGHESACLRVREGSL